MNAFFTKLFGTHRSTRETAHATHPQPLATAIETLEGRRMMDATLSYDGTLSVGASPLNDVASVKYYNSSWIQVNVQQGSGPIRTQYAETSRVKLVVFNGLDGDDTFSNETTVRAIMYGGKGNDYFYGGSAPETLYGEAGNDKLSGGGGDDYIYGGIGDDVLNGGVGRDVIDGEFGNDIIAGDEGDDWIGGGEGNDSLWGGEGNDILGGGNGDDGLFGGAGADRLYGEAGNDRLEGGRDNTGDMLYGGTGKDVFVTDWYWSAGSRQWTNLDPAGDYNPTWEMDSWVNS